MKRQIQTLVALLFIISTLTTSLHELLPHHHSSDCQVCTLVQHDNALAPEKSTLYDVEVYAYEPVLSFEDQYIRFRNPILGSRAPPSFS